MYVVNYTSHGILRGTATTPHVPQPLQQAATAVAGYDVLQPGTTGHAHIHVYLSRSLISFAYRSAVQQQRHNFHSLAPRGAFCCLATCHNRTRAPGHQGAPHKSLSACQKRSLFRGDNSFPIHFTDLLEKNAGGDRN